ncbi:unnamed protein product, partial [Ectocarpus sp. 12 AP-2014]
SKCLLRDVGNGGYRVYDLVLDFVKVKIKADVGMVGKVTVLQAHFLRRLLIAVMEGCEHPEQPRLVHFGCLLALGGETLERPGTGGFLVPRQLRGDGVMRGNCGPSEFALVCRF